MEIWYLFTLLFLFIYNCFDTYQKRCIEKELSNLKKDLEHAKEKHNNLSCVVACHLSDTDMHLEG